MTDYKPYQPVPAKPEKGCLYYGCLTAAVFLILFGIGLGYLGYVLKGYYNNFVEGLSEKPIITAQQYVTPQQEQQLLQRLGQIQEQYKSNQAFSLSLNSQELSLLVHRFINQNNKDEAWPVKISLENGLAILELSVPINERFLNVRTEVEIEIGETDKFQIKNVTVNNKPLSGAIYDAITSTRLEDAINVSSDSEKLQELSKRIKKLKILGSQVYVEFNAE